MRVKEAHLLAESDGSSLPPDWARCVACCACSDLPCERGLQGDGCCSERRGGLRSRGRGRHYSHLVSTAFFLRLPEALNFALTFIINPTLNLTSQCLNHHLYGAETYKPSNNSLATPCFFKDRLTANAAQEHEWFRV